MLPVRMIRGLVLHCFLLALDPRNVHRGFPVLVLLTSVGNLHVLLLGRFENQIPIEQGVHEAGTHGSAHQKLNHQDAEKHVPIVHAPFCVMAHELKDVGLHAKDKCYKHHQLPAKNRDHLDPKLLRQIHVHVPRLHHRGEPLVVQCTHGEGPGRLVPKRICATLEELLRDILRFCCSFVIDNAVRLFPHCPEWLFKAVVDHTCEAQAKHQTHGHVEVLLYPKEYEEVISKHPGHKEEES
mmetsp:Transcript_60071/g.159762  ORF Transcript_60071/g.159762 Transcript_60071/m.159762 type:complete len:239 (-) Transcript_60071:862-1578(-)